MGFSDDLWLIDSQGRLYITSSDPFDYPAIDPGYFSNPAGKFYSPLFTVFFFSDEPAIN